MNLFHKLQNVYFGAVSLREELERIPPQCDCGDADSHLSGQCCCAGTRPHRSQSNTEESASCLKHLALLTKDIEWLREDMQRERKQLRPDENSYALEGRLSLISSLIDGLSSTIVSIEADLKEFRVNCAHPALARLKQRSGEMERYIKNLNEIL